MKWLAILTPFCAMGGIVFAAPVVPQLVTTADVESTTATGHSLAPIIDPSGRFVVFSSHANNLVTNDNLNTYLDLFVRDRIAGITTLVSSDRSGYGGGTGDSAYPCISSNVEFLVFASSAGNLVPNDTNHAFDVFLYDLNSGLTRLISETPTGNVPTAITSGSPFRGSSQPVMTPDARWIVFESTAADLVNSNAITGFPGDTNNGPDLFLRDTLSGTTRLITLGADRPWRSHSPSITSDGAKIAFVSSAANLVPGKSVHNEDVYVHDVHTTNTTWASSNLLTIYGGPSRFRCFQPVMAPDGGSVAYKAQGFPSDLVRVYHHDLVLGVTTLVATNARADTKVVFTRNGRRFVFENDNNVYVHDSVTDLNTLVTVNAARTGPADGVSARPTITPDGRHVAFVSSASNLLPNPLPSSTNISLLYVRDILTEVTRLASVATTGAPSAFDMESVMAAISDDGDIIVFDSDAADLIAKDSNSAYDVFVRDFRANISDLVSRQHPVRSPTTGIQSAALSRWSLSSNAQRVAFTSFDDSRFWDDTNQMVDIFVRDLHAGDLFPQSRSGGVFAPFANGINPIISADGASILFTRERRTTNIAQNFYDLIWRSVDGSAVTQVLTNFFFRTDSWDAALSPNGNLVVYTGSQVVLWDSTAQSQRVLYAGSATRPEFSPDGQWVSFTSDFPFAIRASHVISNRTVLVSKIFNQTVGASSGTFSASGRYFVFHPVGDFGHSYDQAHRYDFQTDTAILVATNCRLSTVNYDGNLLAAVAGPFYDNIYLINITNGTRKLISHNLPGTGAGNDRPHSPLISFDGRYVVFVSRARNLVANDNNNASDIFVHDVVQDTTILVSRNRSGIAGNALSCNPILARDGRTVVFQSFAGDLVDADYNERQDIFVLRLGLGDSDNDGMDDGWEITYFDSLGRNGAGDFDADAQTDLQEFLSGTDPRNMGSVLRVLTVNPMGGGATTVMWSAVPNRNYVVQYKDSLSASIWSNASPVLTAASSSESFVHPSNASQRYYRVIVVQ